MNRECFFWMLSYLLLRFFPDALPCTTKSHAVSGDAVILPCAINTSGTLNISSYSVYWQIHTSVVVHVLHNGKDLTTQQSDRYRNRTKLFLDQLQHGNFSLMLSGVTPDDAAMYTCISRNGVTKKTHRCNVKLSVSAVNNQVMEKNVSLSEKTQALPNCPGNARGLDIPVVCSHLLMMLVVWLLQR